MRPDTRRDIADCELPCPRCGYDMRAHPGPARCPECALEVHVAALAREENAWVERRLIDLWSVGLFLALGELCLIASMLAIRYGQYTAVITGMMAGLYLLAAGMWFAVVAINAARRRMRPMHRTVTAGRRARLRNWLLIDGLLLAGIAGSIGAALWW